MSSFIPIFIINRVSETDRLLHCRNQLEKFFDPFQIHVSTAFEKSEAMALRHGFFSYVAYQNLNSLSSHLVLPTWSAAACALSHYHLWMQIAERKEQMVMVVEDDFMVTNTEKFRFRFNEIAHLFLQRGEQEEAICCLMDGKTIDNGPVPLKPITRIFYNTTRTHAYLLNPAAARLLVRYFLPITYQVDIQMSVLARENSQFYFYNCHDAGTAQSPSFSSQTQYHHLTLSECLELFPDIIATTSHAFLDISDRVMNSPNISYYSYSS